MTGDRKPTGQSRESVDRDFEFFRDTSVAHERLEVTRTPKSRWVLDFGVKMPFFLTPVCPSRFLATRAG